MVIFTDFVQQRASLTSMLNCETAWSFQHQAHLLSLYPKNVNLEERLLENAQLAHFGATKAGNVPGAENWWNAWNKYANLPIFVHINTLNSL